MNTSKSKWGTFALVFTAALHGMAGLPGNWEVRESRSTANLRGVASAPGRVIAVGQDGRILSSDNAINWQRVPYATGGGDFHCVTFGQGIYVAGGTLGCLLAVSSDGLDWMAVQSTAGIQANFGITYGAGRFVLVGRGAPAPNCRLLTSTNGIDWEVPLRPTTNVLRAATFGNGKYVAVGDRGTIITSPDAITWTVQFSGTEHHLRSVIFTGWEFLAGGDSSSLLTSGDGISWGSVPFSSFDVRSLATCGTAVVAVGGLAGAGRAQASADGLLWTEPASTLPAQLNAVVQYDAGRFIAVGNGGLIVDSTAWADTPVNVWAKAADGYWDESFWSLGHLPSWKDHSIVFTNAGTRTLNIDDVTARDYPESLRLRELVLDAPEGSRNTLLLNNAGAEVALLMDRLLQVGTNASLIISNSVIEAATFKLGGEAIFAPDAQVRLGMLAFEGGTIKASGSHYLGQLILAGNGNIDLQAVSTTLRFAESAGVAWTNGTYLTLSNWTPATDKFFIGEDAAGLAPTQLSSVRFVNPGGFSPGIYSARIASTGEVVPIPRLIAYQRGANGIVLTWPEGYRLLSATNVAGPYSLIIDAISPYNASYTDPQRFFIIGNEN